MNNGWEWRLPVGRELQQMDDWRGTWEEFLGERLIPFPRMVGLKGVETDWEQEQDSDEPDDF